MLGFAVVYRNPGHWDILRHDIGRVFRIRGDIGDVVVSDERKQQDYRGPRGFKTVAAAMAFIVDELMFEHLASDGDSMLDSSGNQLMAIAKD